MDHGRICPHNNWQRQRHLQTFLHDSLLVASLWQA